jgi:hypothetical protein
VRNRELLEYDVTSVPVFEPSVDRGAVPVGPSVERVEFFVGYGGLEEPLEEKLEETPVATKLDEEDGNTVETTV